MGHTVIVVGGGFGGAAVARALGRRAEVTLISDHNYLLFSPMLAEVAAADLDPRHILAPLRQICPRARVVIGTVIDVDGQRRTVTVRSPVDGSTTKWAGDAVVLAAGSEPATFGVPGVADHALAFKTIQDALAIRTRLLRLLEAATVRPDPALTSVAIVGAGYSGSELAAALADFLERAFRRYYWSAPTPAVTLIDAVDRVVPTLPPKASASAVRALERRGVMTRLGSPVREIRAGEVLLGDGSTVRAATIVWSAGTTGAPIPGIPGAEAGHGGRLPVDDQLRLAEGVWALGDVARVPDGRGGVCPPTAQHAIRQGAYLGRHLPAMLDGRPAPRFAYRTVGELVALGHRNAVGRVLGMTVTGFPAWFLWRSYYLLRLPTLSRKVRVALDWTIDLMFPPDVADPATADPGPDLGGPPLTPPGSSDPVW